MYNSLEEAVLDYGIIQKEKLAVANQTEQITYGMLRQKILMAVNQIRKCEVKKGDTILVQAVSNSNYIAAYLALHVLGVVVVPVDRKSSSDVLMGIMDKLKAKYIVGVKRKVEKIGNSIFYEDIYATENIDEVEQVSYSQEDVYDILYTTGTTGNSKGVVTTRKSVNAAMMNEIEGPHMTKEDVLMIPIPLNHSFGIGKLRAILFLGGTVILQNGFGMVAEIKKSMDTYHCTALICVPSALQILYEQVKGSIGQILENVRFIEAASAPFSVELKESLAKQLPNTHIINRYGSTETPAAVYLDTKIAPDKVSSIGKAVSQVRVKVIDDHENEINSSSENVGRLAISGPMVMKGYFEDEELTHQFLHSGWMYSNDLAYIDSDGYIYLVGRNNDVINSGGKKISPQEVEDIVMKWGHIKECAITGVKDPKGILGDVPVLVYVTEENLDEKELMDYLRNSMEKFKVPVKCVKVKALPRNYMGKLERNKIKEMIVSK